MNLAIEKLNGILKFRTMRRVQDMEYIQTAFKAIIAEYVFVEKKQLTMGS